MRTIAGAGKTVLCSKAIGHVLHSRSPNWGKSNIIYFFFDFNDIFKQNVESMVRSLIYQLLAKADEVPEAVQKFYAKHQSTASVVSSPRSEEWQDILVALLRDTDQTFVFIDALDECADSESPILGGTIQRLFKEGGAHAKWLLTARPSARPLSFREEFGFENLHMEEGAVNRDIELHLKVRLQNDPKLSTFAPKAKEMIISSIVSASGGMWVISDFDLLGCWIRLIMCQVSICPVPVKCAFKTQRPQSQNDSRGPRHNAKEPSIYILSNPI